VIISVICYRAYLLIVDRGSQHKACFPSPLALNLFQSLRDILTIQPCNLR
jgi:hypothetical protein